MYSPYRNEDVVETVVASLNTSGEARSRLSSAFGLDCLIGDSDASSSCLVARADPAVKARRSGRLLCARPCLALLQAAAASLNAAA